MTPTLILFAESLDIRFAVRIEEILASLLPRRSELRRGDVPARPASHGKGLDEPSVYAPSASLFRS